MGDLMKKGILIFATQWEVLEDDSFLPAEFQITQDKGARCTPITRHPRGNRGRSETPLTEYRQAYITYMNARIQRRRDDEVLEHRRK